MLGPKSLFRDLEARGVKLQASGLGHLQILHNKDDISQAEANWIKKYNKELLQIVVDRAADKFLVDNSNSIILGQNQDILPHLRTNSTDAYISDPSYGYGIMRKPWDKPIPVETLKECYRTLKPGGWGVFFSAPRQDVLLIVLQNLKAAGFEIHHSPIYWTYASGFPKAKSISKEIDKRFPESDKAIHLDGLYAGFQPKPAVEVIVIVRKPILEKSCTDQALKDGKGGTWMDDCRIPYVDEKPAERDLASQKSSTSGQVPASHGDKWIGSGRGRFPANLLVSDDILDDGKKQKPSVGKSYAYSDREYDSKGFLPVTKTESLYNYNDQGGYSRYFSLDAWVERNHPFLIVSKATKKEKNAGLAGLEADKVNDGRKTAIDNPFQRGETLRLNTNPCVKPVKLMAYLVTMFSRPGDLIVDPFAGSGSTCIAAKLLNRQFIGIEQDEEYYQIAKQRVDYASKDDPFWENRIDGLGAVDKADDSDGKNAA